MSLRKSLHVVVSAIVWLECCAAFGADIPPGGSADFANGCLEFELGGEPSANVVVESLSASNRAEGGLIVESKVIYDYAGETFGTPSFILFDHGTDGKLVRLNDLLDDPVLPLDDGARAISSIGAISFGGTAATIWRRKYWSGGILVIVAVNHATGDFCVNYAGVDLGPCCPTNCASSCLGCPADAANRSANASDPVTMRVTNNTPDAMTADIDPTGRACTPSVPTVSEWGILVMTLLVLVAGTAFIRMRRTVGLPAQP